ncbi:MAG: TrkH family potassium uptake protein [Desulfobacterales bacterium]
MFSPNAIFRSPARVSIYAFATLISIGTALLMLPAASTVGRLRFVDALFTAASASCVTGLAVVDTGSALSAFGQLVILVVIQSGGLGIMTISTLFLLLGGRRPSLAGRMLIQDTFTRGGERSVRDIIWSVVQFTLVIEGIGALLLFPRFLSGMTAGDALYCSVFHAVSAFCNAGFSLFPDSLIAYREDYILNLVICFLIICGGIGFLVLSELRQNFSLNRCGWSRLSLHSRLVLTVTGILLISSSMTIIFMEWHNTLAPLSLPGRVLAGFFQAVSARTAGFNTLAVNEMANETLFLLILLMFIGASPGSCGGGVKTSTFASLVVLGLSRLRGKERPQIFHRTISTASIGKAISVVLISTIIIMVANMVILMVELGETPHPMSRGKFLELLFEVVSAFGTVGLSAGVTAGLSMAGKLILSMVMFVGRLGPLVVAMAVSRGTAPRFYYAEEEIMSG